jgi:hypothetical protein
VDTIGIWIAAILTIAIYSFLFKENKMFTFAEHLFLGLAVGHAAVLGYQNVINSAVNPLVQKGQMMWLVPLLGGALLFTRLFPPYAWLSRIPLGFMMGVAAGLSLKRAIDSEFWAQAAATVNLGLTSLDNVIYLVTVVAVLVYFFFGVSEKSPGGAAVMSVGKLGQYLMMIAFGASLGSTIMARLSLVIGRLQFLFGTWIPILPK